MFRRGGKEKSLAAMLSQLPSAKDFAKDLALEEGEKLGANPCGEKDGDASMYKLLTREGIMLTYNRVGNQLRFIYKQRLHK